MNDFPLTIELIPQTSWYNNLRSLMPKEAWDVLRKKILSESDHTCAICHANGTLHCHEVWEYNDTDHIQTLIAIIPLCELCHAVKHIGQAQSRSKEFYDSVITHFMQVNQCNRMAFEIHRIEAFAQFEERSKHEWRLDIGEYQGVNHLL